MNKNTYSLMFGKEPLQFISRSSQVAMITESFISEPVAQQIYLLTGLRGSGKTVMMNEIQHKMITKKDWIIVELSPERDMLEALASKLSSEKQLFLILICLFSVLVYLCITVCRLQILKLPFQKCWKH